jgi:hypothetical protein
MSVTNKCFCLGFTPEQGVGFSEYTNYWVFPLQQTGVVKVQDSYNNERVIVLNDSDDYFYEIGLRQFNSDSSTQRIYKDKTNISGLSGYDIPTEVTFKGDIGEYEKYYLENYSNRFFVKPTNSGNIGDSDYDTYGIPSGIVFNLSINVDGYKTISITDVNINNEIVSHIKAEGSVLQSTLSSTQSDFRLVGRQQDYIVKDIQYSTENRSNDITDYQEFLSTPLLWVTRGESKGTELISLGTVSGYTDSTGPDTRTNSAMTVSGSSIVLGSTTNTSSKIFSTWISGSATFNFYNGAVYNLQDQTFTTHDTYGSWRLVYASGITATGTINIAPSGTCRLFDIRMYATTDTSYLAYMFDDVTDNYGDNICPMG